MRLRMLLVLIMLYGAAIVPTHGQLILQTESAEGQGEPGDEEFGDQDCDCYYDVDCPEFSGCNVGTPMCLNVGKLDGLCEEWQSPQPGGESDPDESRAAVSKAVELYFELFIQIVAQQGAGTPKPEAVRQIDGILGWPSRVKDAKKPRRPVVLKRQPLIDMLNNSLDRVLGFDFNISPVQEFGNVRHVPDREQAIALIKTTRAAFLRAIEQRSGTAVRGPLAKFWASFPNYRPMHTGRCYPHGHPEQKSPLECQVESLSRMAKRLVSALPK